MKTLSKIKSCLSMALCLTLVFGTILPISVSAESKDFSSKAASFSFDQETPLTGLVEISADIKFDITTDPTNSCNFLLLYDSNWNPIAKLEMNLVGNVFVKPYDANCKVSGCQATDTGNWYVRYPDDNFVNMFDGNFHTLKILVNTTEGWWRCGIGDSESLSYRVHGTDRHTSSYGWSSVATDVDKVAFESQSTGAGTMTVENFTMKKVTPGTSGTVTIGEAAATAPLAANTAIKVNANYFNDGAYKLANTALIAAMYDSTGKLVDIVYDSAENLASGYSKAINDINWTTPKTDGATIKVFAWDTLSGLAPLDSVVTFP